MSRILKTLASTRLTVVLLFLLSILVFWGTLYQAEYGLYAAQQRFYSSYFFTFFGFIPFPGSQTVLSVLFLNLLAAVLVSIRMRVSNLGSILTHVGLLLFLLGGFIIQLYTREASLTLKEGEGSNAASSYQDWELAVWPATGPQATPESGRKVSAVASDHFRAGSQVDLPVLNAKIQVLEYHRNSVPATPQAGRDAAAVQNASRIKALDKRPRNKEPASDVPGALFEIEDETGKRHTLLLYGRDARATALPLGDTTWFFSLRRQRLPLPFTIVLNDFQRETHQQSSMARSFASEVTVVSGDSSRPVRISMNKPLRYGGFTLFQSSYRETQGGAEYSTFAVVFNRGRYLPYAGTLVVFLGMVIHFVRAIYRKRMRSS